MRAVDVDVIQIPSGWSPFRSTGSVELLELTQAQARDLTRSLVSCVGGVRLVVTYSGPLYREIWLSADEVRDLIKALGAWSPT